jgi:hypothetical protein
MKTRNILFTLLVVLLASLSSCKKDNIEPDHYTISGVVYDTAGIPLPEVNICLQDTIDNVLVFVNLPTDMNGAYLMKVEPHHNATITPSKVGGFVFDPAQMIYTNVQQNYVQDYHQRKPLN